MAESAALQASDIRWTSPAIARLEDTDVLRLTETELLAYCADLQSEIRSLRHLVYASVNAIAALTDQATRCARVIDRQRQQLRDRRARAV